MDREGNFEFSKYFGKFYRCSSRISFFLASGECQFIYWIAYARITYESVNCCLCATRVYTIRELVGGQMNHGESTNSFLNCAFFFVSKLGCCCPRAPPRRCALNMQDARKWRPTATDTTKIIILSLARRESLSIPGYICV